MFILIPIADKDITKKEEGERETCIFLVFKYLEDIKY